MVLRSLLHSRGVQSDKALTGAEAIRLYEKRMDECMRSSDDDSSSGYYKIILLDFSMPEMDGPEVSRRIREMTDARNLRQPVIICCSAYDDAAYQDKAIQAGMNSYFVKPVSDADISRIIAHL